MHAARQGVRSGTILVETALAKGRLFFRRGKIIGALWGNLEGMPALEQMTKVRDANSGIYFEPIITCRTSIRRLPTNCWTLQTPALTWKRIKGLASRDGSLSAMDVYELFVRSRGFSNTYQSDRGVRRRHRRNIQGSQQNPSRSVEGKEGPLNAMAAIMSWNGLRFILRTRRTSFLSPLTSPWATSSASDQTHSGGDDSNSQTG